MSNILITGASGLVGSALKELLPNALCPTSKELNLLSYIQLREYFMKNRIDKVINLSARVGGVKANTNFIGDFYTENVLMNTNLLEVSKFHKVKKLVSLMSTCVYPENATYPLTEDQLHNGNPHSSNFGYAFAKRMLDVQSRAYRQQYGSNFITVIPNNLYGPNDQFHLEDSHVIPALIHKFHLAKQNNQHFMEVWGSGNALREFTYSHDIAKILIFLMENYNEAEPINIGNTEEISIKDLAYKIKDLVGFKGELVWDTNKPEGILRKPSSNQKLLNLGWQNYTPLGVGLKQTVEWFINNYPNVRGIL